MRRPENLEAQHFCYACGGKFNHEKKGDRKVRDHCHFSGKFRGALHLRCNLMLARSRTIPVYRGEKVCKTKVYYLH